MSFYEREQVGQGRVEETGEDEDFFVADDAALQLDVGEDVAGDVPTGELALNDELRLGEAALKAESADLRAGDV